MSVIHWEWLFDTSRQTLQIAMDGVLLDISYPRRALQQNLPAQAAFDLEDANLFQRTRDYLEEHAPLGVNQQLQAAIHITAAARFLKPSMPQSWHFRFGDVFEPWPDTHMLCKLDSGLAAGDFLIVEQTERSSLCMLLDDNLRLSPTKELKRFECIRVINDRLQPSPHHPLPQRWQSDWSSLA